MEFQLHKLSSPAKKLIVFFIVSLLIGYGIALLKVHIKTGFAVTAVVQNYRGSPNPDIMAFPKTYDEILQNTHAHALSVPLIYFLLGGLLLGTRLKSKLKSALIIILFAGFFLEYASLWGLRYISESFAYLLYAGSLASGIAYVFICFRILRDLKSSSNSSGLF